MNGYLTQTRNKYNVQFAKEQQRRILLNSDPLNPEYQRVIQQEIGQENINQNYYSAIENMPEAFGHIVMLYVPIEIEGVKINAFVDSGAQTTIISKELAMKCKLRTILLYF